MKAYPSINSGFDSVGFQGDEYDFSDNIAMQQEVNRLRGDVQRLQAECQHWKTVCQQNVSCQAEWIFMIEKNIDCSKKS